MERNAVLLVNCSAADKVKKRDASSLLVLIETSRVMEIELQAEITKFSRIE